MAERPTKTPSQPATLPIVALPDQVATARSTKRMVRLPKTTCSETLMRSVAMNMSPVKTPQASRYQPTAVVVGASMPIHLGNASMATKLSQNRPYEAKAVAPNTLFFLYS